MSEQIIVALAGNPNSGKTSIFNALTCSQHHVGNYPGVTVEKREGSCRHGEVVFKVVDLPGTYSLTASSPEEVVARDFLLHEKPDVIINVLDAGNLERHLYLTTQLLELNIPMVLAFNMSDMAHKQGLVFNHALLAKFFNCPIVDTVGSKGRGMEELLAAAVRQAAQGPAMPPQHLSWPEDIQVALTTIEKKLKKLPLASSYPLRWLAIKVLEKDPLIMSRINQPDVVDLVDHEARRLHLLYHDTPDMLIADARYGFISGACQEAVTNTIEVRHTISDKVDQLLLSRFLGFPIFLGMMYLVFYLTFTLSAPLMHWLSLGFGALGGMLGSLWPAGSESALKSLLKDGIVGGVGSVLVFLPNIMFLFMSIAVLEDSGYMARAAFLMDRIMHKIGLHGKSFIPMLLGFGCSVPAMLATRTLETRRDRLVTMAVIPLISCGARLPIYMLIVPAFFPKAWEAPMLMLIYLIGIGLAIAGARLLTTTVFKGESSPFVMELPPYRVPTLRGVMTHMWRNAWEYVKKAGTIILGIAIVLWVLTSYPKPPVPSAALAAQGAQVRTMTASQRLEHSFAGQVGKAMEPVIGRMGFDWRIGTALLGSLAAKEVFVAQLGIIFAVGEKQVGQLRQQLQAAYSPLVGFCILLFTLIASPCMATFATMRKESGSWTWAVGQWLGLTLLGLVVATLVYQGGRLFHL